jgi:hypothetical protein
MTMPAADQARSGDCIEDDVVAAQEAVGVAVVTLGFDGELVAGAEGRRVASGADG